MQKFISLALILCISIKGVNSSTKILREFSLKKKAGLKYFDQKMRKCSEHILSVKSFTKLLLACSG